MNYYLLFGGVSLFCWSFYKIRSGQLKNKRYNRLDGEDEMAFQRRKGTRGLS